MRTRGILPFAAMAAAFMLLAGVVFAGRGSLAQDMASPTPQEVHPAHIHAGTCATLGEVVFPLEDVSSANIGPATPMAGMEGTAETGSSSGTDMAANAMASPGPVEMGNVVAASTTTVNATLDVILGAEHAINVHESMDAIQNYIACGDITGTPTNGQLEVTLNELNNSGYQGHATLKDNGDGTTTVMVQLWMSNMGTATPTM